MKSKILFLLIFCMFLITGCMSNSSKIHSNIKQNNIKESSIKMSNIKVIINDKTYILKLESNKAVDDFINLLPQKFTMNDLNGNEKYVYMDRSFTTNSYNPNHIDKGDVMLFGDNCLVIFYKSFDTNYSYTKLGHIDGLNDLGSENIDVTFR